MKRSDMGSVAEPCGVGNTFHLAPATGMQGSPSGRRRVDEGTLKGREEEEEKKGLQGLEERCVLSLLGDINQQTRGTAKGNTGFFHTHHVCVLVWGRGGYSSENLKD